MMEPDLPCLYRTDYQPSLGNCGCENCLANVRSHIRERDTTVQALSINRDRVAGELDKAQRKLKLFEAAQKYCEAKLRAEQTTKFKDLASTRQELYAKKRQAWRDWRDANGT